MNRNQNNLIEAIASDAVIRAAFNWLCKQREHYSHNMDIWDLRWRWDQIKPKLQADLVAGTFKLSSTTRIRKVDRTMELWSSIDALVLKATAIVLTEHLKPDISEQCHHISGNGGGKAAVRAVISTLKDNEFVFRTDVKKYYASIDHKILMNMLKIYLTDKRVLDLLRAYMQRVIVDRGVYREVSKGISLGCPLSPLMGALYLKPIDDLMAKSEVTYARFMDDWVILSPTRWKLRAVIAKVNQILDRLKVKQHPGKTFIGRISKGFDFLGYHFTTDSLTVAAKTFNNFVTRSVQLYEQKRGSANCSTSSFEQYVKRWNTWRKSGLRQYVNNLVWDDRHLKELNPVLVEQEFTLMFPFFSSGSSGQKSPLTQKPIIEL